MIEINLTLSPEAVDSGDFIYVWIKSYPNREPFYVGETSKGVADRVGLHIRNCGSTTRSGAIVGKMIHKEQWPEQEYTVLAFEVSETTLNGVAKENGAGASKASRNRARKAVESALHQSLISEYKNMRRPKVSKWKAMSASVFIAEAVSKCHHNVKNMA